MSIDSLRFEDTMHLRAVNKEIVFSYKRYTISTYKNKSIVSNITIYNSNYIYK